MVRTLRTTTSNISTDLQTEKASCEHDLAPLIDLCETKAERGIPTLPQILYIAWLKLQTILQFASSLAVANKTDDEFAVVCGFVSIDFSL